MPDTLNRTLSTPTVLPPSSSLATDVHGLKAGIVNLALIGSPGVGDGGWTLIDAGLPGYTHTILRRASELFGSGREGEVVPPAAVVLTHGHFDHIGSLHSLLRAWQSDGRTIPIYAHPLELPYLTGRSAYPPADPSVGGGLLARTARLFPPGPFDFRPNIQPLPPGGIVPTLPDWEYIETPGHSPDHISLFRREDGVLIAGDAFVTTRQQALFPSLSASLFIQGPPWYYTPDFSSAHESIQKLRRLMPSKALTGHGPVVEDEALLRALSRVDEYWDDPQAGITPPNGRYRQHPAVTDEEGVREVPPPVFDPVQLGLYAGMGMLAVAGLAAVLKGRTGGRSDE
jgi:glyoxylase-like metal-dependent hydrolase (beta-lactamase superfamily II)